VDVGDSIARQDGAAAESDLDALRARERARDDSNPDDDRERLAASVPDAHWVQARPGHLLARQVRFDGGSDNGLPDAVQVVGTNGLELLRDEVGLGTLGLDPKLNTGTRNELWLGGEAVVVVGGLDGRRDAEADADRRLGVD
jgi:hypothetical protein